MALVVPNDSDVLMLKYIVNQLAQDGGSPPVGGQRVLRLFSNNLTPSKTTDLTSNITETTVGGYTAITLIGSNWTVATSSTGTNTAVYSEQTFSFSSATTIYGYYVTTTEMAPNLLWVERFSTAPFILPAGGGEIAIVPRLTLD